MKPIAFHFNVAAPVPYLCRLLRKASHAGQRAWVLLPPPWAAELDAALWTFAPHEFIAHARHGCSPEALWRRAPVVLAEQVPPQTDAHWPLLINLLAPLPEGWQGFARLIEIVPQDEALKQAARQRWRSYAGQGRAIERHDASLASASVGSGHSGMAA